MEKTVKPLFFDKIYDKNYKFDSNSIKIDNGLLCLMMKRLQVFNIAKILFLPDWPSIMKPANRMKLVVGKDKDHPCIISVKKSTSVKNTTLTWRLFSLTETIGGAEKLNTKKTSQGRNILLKDTHREKAP